MEFRIFQYIMHYFCLFFKPYFKSRRKRFRRPVSVDYVQFVLQLFRRCGDKAEEQRMRFVGTALEFRMELDAHKEILSRNLNGLHQPSVR
jgi:hypothetical protein